MIRLYALNNKQTTTLYYRLIRSAYQGEIK